MQAVGESGVGAAARTATWKKRKAAGGAFHAGGWTEAEEAAVRQACEATKGQPYEEAYEEYKRASARSMDAFVKKAGKLGYTWPRSKK
jgi:hypothetical protein